MTYIVSYCAVCKRYDMLGMLLGMITLAVGGATYPNVI